MHKSLEEIPTRILQYATGALTQANQHAIFFDPGNEHWGFMSVANAAHAGELFIKAIIAEHHPLLIFKDFFNLDQGQEDIELKELIKRGKTHDFDKLPRVFWAVTGKRIPNQKAYDKLRAERNAIQHFCSNASDSECRSLSLDFIYSVIDPLINKHFGLCAIEFHEDYDGGYTYVAGCLLRHQIKFSIPKDFEMDDLEVEYSLKDASESYRDWYTSALSKIKDD